MPQKQRTPRSSAPLAVTPLSIERKAESVGTMIFNPEYRVEIPLSGCAGVEGTLSFVAREDGRDSIDVVIERLGQPHQNCEATLTLDELEAFGRAVFHVARRMRDVPILSVCGDVFPDGVRPDKAAAA